MLNSHKENNCVYTYIYAYIYVQRGKRIIKNWPISSLGKEIFMRVILED